MDSFSMPLRSPRLLWGGRVNPLMLRPVRTRLDSTLDDIIHGEAAGGRLSPQLGIDLLGQHLQQMTRRDRSGNSSSPENFIL
ncbi:hypothetical protein F7725_020410 [Dissostichus mawsoni]|uniref:Uncharacterized protein n=1 Tax=Dissostichus mawsoni TaxID=36200 RepID=A0A7J5YD60_DISMA|nr:hypothetical protein F7725_020410 [Dissostichus mawsoni]